MVIYPHPEGGEVRLSNGFAVHVRPDGSERLCSAAEERRWYSRLARDNRAAGRMAHGPAKWETGEG
jgi:hypothetical protein